MIDLRSDTVTKPTPAMREAMFAAEVGDDVFAEDPSVNALEEEVARLLGKEAALYVPSGTMANQIAIYLHCRPGDSVICEKDSHVFLYEAGAAAAITGVQFDLIPWEKKFSDEAMSEAYREDNLHSAPSTLLVVENTHNRQAGRVLGKEELMRIAARGRSLGLKLHCDGARLWNAAQATGTAEQGLAAPFDTVAVCFSKGLGAPVGSALCGPKDMIARARKVRKRWGGGMRQAGFLAAACRYALKHHRERLKEDHRHAALLVDGLKDALGSRVETRYPELGTNMVYFRVEELSGAILQESLAKQGVRIMNLSGQWMRAVTHLHITAADIEQTVTAVKSIAAKN